MWLLHRGLSPCSYQRIFVFEWLYVSWPAGWKPQLMKHMIYPVPWWIFKTSNQQSSNKWQVFNLRRCGSECSRKYHVDIISFFLLIAKNSSVPSSGGLRRNVKLLWYTVSTAELLVWTCSAVEKKRWRMQDTFVERPYLCGSLALQPNFNFNQWKVLKIKMYYTAALKQLPIQSPITRSLLRQCVFLAICLKVKTINMQVYCSQLCLRLSSCLAGGTREKAHWANKALGIPPV